MGKIAIGVVAFAAGAVAGGLFVRWYVQTHAGQLAGEAIGGKLADAGYPTAGRLVSGLLTGADQLRGAA